MKKIWAVFKREYRAGGPEEVVPHHDRPDAVPLRGADDRAEPLRRERDRAKSTSSSWTGPGGSAPSVTEALRAPEPVDALKTATQNLEKPDHRRAPLPGSVRADYVDASGKNPKDVAAPFLERLHAERDAEPAGRRLHRPGRRLRRLVPLDDVLQPLVDRPHRPGAARPRRQSRPLAGAPRRARGLNPSEIDSLLRDLRVEAVQLTKAGEEKTGGEMNFLVGFVFVLLIFLPVLLYGQEVMRGIIQEKTDRIVEILVSSMTPFELLSGKILGMAAVGLTQIAVWVAMGGAIAAYGAAAAHAAGVNLGQFLRPSLAVWFVVFFVLGYLINVCVYAVGGRDRELGEGSAAGPDARDASS